MTFMRKEQKESKQADNGIFFRLGDFQCFLQPLGHIQLNI